jgi:hypothetical protein
LTRQSKKRLNPENFSHRHIASELHERRCRLAMKLSGMAALLTLLCHASSALFIGFVCIYWRCSTLRAA